MNMDEPIEMKVDKILARFDISDEHIKRRKPKQPTFRYLSAEESKEEIEKETIEHISVMTKPGTPKVTMNNDFEFGLGHDMDTVENIIRKHQESRKFKEK